MQGDGTPYPLPLANLSLVPFASRVVPQHLPLPCRRVSACNRERCRSSIFLPTPLYSPRDMHVKCSHEQRIDSVA